MPNLASALKEEILRLARKEVRAEIEGIKKASGKYRSDIAGLKQRLAALEKLMSRAGKKADQQTPVQGASNEKSSFRFSAKGLISLRQRLGVSAADMGILLGVSAQTIYNWESGNSKPRQQQQSSIVSVRKMGKRQIATLLAQVQGE